MSVWTTIVSDYNFDGANEIGPVAGLRNGFFQLRGYRLSASGAD